MIPIISEIQAEAKRAAEQYGNPASSHESLGVLLEEFDELKQAIHDNDQEAVIHEAIQVAAVAYRLALICAEGDADFCIRSGFGRC